MTKNNKLNFIKLNEDILTETVYYGYVKRFTNSKNESSHVINLSYHSHICLQNIGYYDYEVGNRVCRKIIIFYKNRICERIHKCSYFIIFLSKARILKAGRSFTNV